MLPMKVVRFIGLLVFGWFWMLSASYAQTAPVAATELRVALVIGNSTYQKSPLLNPKNDAKKMSEALRKLGFLVTELHDVTQSQFKAALDQLQKQLQGQGGVGLFYYAGHGVQIGWKNYLVPVDAVVGSPEDIAKIGIDLNQVIDAFKNSGSRFSVVVLDACRNNPFDTNTAEVQFKGLAPMVLPDDIFLAYATLPGNVAEDGAETDGNGLYTSHLLEELTKRPDEISNVFRRTQLRVRQNSKGRQVPSESYSSKPEFSFNPSLVTKHPNFTAERDIFFKQAAEWDDIKRMDDPLLVYAFLDKYPTGGISELALAQLNILQRVNLFAQPSRAEQDLVDQERLYNPKNAADRDVASRTATSRYGALDAANTERFRWGDRYLYLIKEYGFFTRSFDKLMSIVYIRTFTASAYLGLYSYETFTSIGGRITDASAPGLPSGTFYDPPLALTPAEFKLGYQWTSSSKVMMSGPIKAVATLNARVTGVESITVGEHQFVAYQIAGVKELVFDNAKSKPQKVAFKSWLSPQHGLPLKYEERDPETGKLIRSETLAQYTAGNK